MWTSQPAWWEVLFWNSFYLFAFVQSICSLDVLIYLIKGSEIHFTFSLWRFMNSKLKAANGLLVYLHRTSFPLQKPKKSSDFVKYQILKSDLKNTGLKTLSAYAKMLVQLKIFCGHFDWCLKSFVASHLYSDASASESLSTCMT